MPQISSPPTGADLAISLLQKARGSTPLAIEEIDTILRLIAAARPTVRQVLDLGCGNGMLTGAILDEHPDAHAVVVAPAGTSCPPLHPEETRVRRVNGDPAEPGWERGIPRSLFFDVALFALSPEPLADERRKVFFQEVQPLLAPGGFLLCVETVASAIRWTESPLDDGLIQAIFGEQMRETPGKSRADVEREYYEAGRVARELIAPLEVQCDWLRELGYLNVETFLKVGELAVFGGQAPLQPAALNS